MSETDVDYKALKASAPTLDYEDLFNAIFRIFQRVPEGETREGLQEELEMRCDVMIADREGSGP